MRLEHSVVPKRKELKQTKETDKSHNDGTYQKDTEAN